MTVPLNKNSSGDGVCSDRTLFTSVASPSSSSSCRALATATTAGILDLDAVSAAAARSQGSGGGSESGSGSPAGKSTRHHPRNRFAPMTKSEVERFLLQPSISPVLSPDDD